MARRKKKKLRIGNILIFLMIILLLGGGITVGLKFLQNNNSNNIDIEDINDDNDSDDKEPAVQIVDVNSKSRPYAVMINNLSTARPYHTGLQNAYLVYEIIVEGGITRYLALFKDNLPEVVGSVRSARHYYLDYALENDAYYVHWGWSPQAQSDIKSLNVDNLNGLTAGSPYFFRKKLNISSEHTGYVNLKEMVKLANQKSYHKESTKSLLLKYSAEALDLSNFENKLDAKSVNLKYSNSFITNYIYDENEKVYKQFVNNKEHNDYETREQYTVKNIITYKVASKTISGDNKGRQDIDNIGTGDGYYITEGMAIPITWEKKSRTAQTVYRYKNGTEITVNDGNTWIHIVPTSGDISIS